MDWGFLDIFKKADFNTLMLSVAITGWILYLHVSTNMYFLGAAIICSVYCFLRLIVYTYQLCSLKLKYKREKIQKAKEKETKIAEERNRRNIEISRMFLGLTADKKKRLAHILLKGEKDIYKDNMLLFSNYNIDPNILTIARATTNIFRGPINDGVNTIELKYYTDTTAVIIDPYLYDLIKKYINENGFKLNNKNKIK